MNDNRISQFSGTPPANGQPPVKLYRYQIFVRAPGVADERPVAEIQTGDVRSALLMFLAQIAGGAAEIREVRAVRVEPLIHTP